MQKYAASARDLLIVIRVVFVPQDLTVVNDHPVNLVQDVSDPGLVVPQVMISFGETKAVWISTDDGVCPHTDR